MALPNNLPQSAYIKLWWRIDETSGTNVADSSGNSHNGTASRTQILAGADGNIATSGTFVATSSDKITIANHVDLQPTKIFSLACWVNTTQVGTFIGIIDKYTGSPAGYMLDIPANNGKPRFVIVDTADRTTTATVAVNNGAWHHVCGVYDGTNIIIYIDGSASGTPTAASANLTNDTHVFSVGGDGVSTNYYTGNIDEVISCCFFGSIFIV